MKIEYSWNTFERTVEYGEKGSRLVDYALLFFLTIAPKTPRWLQTAHYWIHHSRDLIELFTCGKELGCAYRGVSGIDESEGARLHNKLNPTRRWGDAFICLSAISTPLAIFHEWLGLPLGRWAGAVEALGKWTIALGHAVCLFGIEKGEDKSDTDVFRERVDMGVEALFFGMEAGFLEVTPIPVQALISVGSGAWGVWRNPDQHAA